MANRELNHGLSDNTVDILTQTFKKFPDIHTVILYGSRARGNYHQGSDIDLAVSAPRMNDDEFSRLRTILDELPLIYKIDCLHRDKLSNQHLLKNINQYGVVLFSRNSKN